MPLPTQSPLSIDWPLRAESLRPRGIIRYSIDAQYLVSTDEFSVTFWDSDPARLRALALEPVTLNIDGEPVLTGRIERVERGDDGRAVTVIGRDYFSELTEGHLDPSVKINADQTFADVILFCAGPYGISAVAGINGADKLKPGERKPESGQGVYDFLNRIAARLGVTLQPSANDRTQVLLSQPDYERAPVLKIFRSTDPVASTANNVISARSAEDYTRIPTVGLSTGKVAEPGKSPSTASTEYDTAGALAGISDNVALALSKVVAGRVKPADGHRVGPELYRLLFVKDDNARTAEQVEQAIVRAVSERAKDSLTYTASLRGHRISGDGPLYSVNTVAEVYDDPCELYANLWVSGVRYSYDRGQGSTTELTCWNLGAFYIGKS